MSSGQEKYQFPNTLQTSGRVQVQEAESSLLSMVKRTIERSHTRSDQKNHPAIQTKRN